MENQWAGCQILITLSGHKVQLTAKSVFLCSGCFSGWQHAAQVKSNEVYLFCWVQKQQGTKTPVGFSTLVTKGGGGNYGGQKNDLSIYKCMNKKKRVKKDIY